MRPSRVVMLLPRTDDVLRLGARVKVVDTETFVPWPTVEGFDEPVSPGLPWRNKPQARLDSSSAKGLSDEYGRTDTGLVDASSKSRPVLLFEK